MPDEIKVETLPCGRKLYSVDIGDLKKEKVYRYLWALIKEFNAIPDETII